MIKTLKDTAGYIKAGLREFVRLKQGFFFLFIVALIAIPVSATTIGGQEYYHWYRYCVYEIVGACINIYFIQFVLKKYRPVFFVKRSIALCLIWYFSFSIISLSVYRVLAYLVPELGHFFTSIGAAFATAVLMSPVWFYPPLVLENSKNPVRRSFELVKRHYMPLILIWCAFWSLDNILVYSLTMKIYEMMKGAADYAAYTEYRYLLVFMRLEFTVVWAVLMAAISTATYLKITNSESQSTD